MKQRVALLLVAVLITARCADFGAPPPTVTPTGEDRFLIDPRIGYNAPTSRALERRFDVAWRLFIVGQRAAAHQRFEAIRAKEPGYLPAALGEAAIAIHEGRLEEGGAIVDHVQGRVERYTAADVYAAEIALAEHRTDRAYDVYRDVALRTEVPQVVRERLADVAQRLFDELFLAARTAPNGEAARLLREALTINPAASAARILLADKLIAQRNYDDARRVLDPILSTEANRADFQEALAEIDVGHGRYEEAIARYERLVRRERDPRYARRLEEVKQEWVTANMPPQFQAAIQSSAITRADFAVLLYWKVTSVRFAQNLGTPPIAIDIDVPGREELIRAITLGVLQVDPVTQRIVPSTAVPAGNFVRLAARVLLVRAAACARQVPAEPSELTRAQKILDACGVSDPTAGAPTDAPVSGRAAAAVMEQIDRLSSQ